MAHPFTLMLAETGFIKLPRPYFDIIILLGDVTKFPIITYPECCPFLSVKLSVSHLNTGQPSHVQCQDQRYCRTFEILISLHSLCRQPSAFPHTVQSSTGTVQYGTVPV